MNRKKESRNKELRNKESRNQELQNKESENKDKGNHTQEKSPGTSLKEDLLFLLIKIGILAGLLLVTFVFVFGIFRNTGNAMFPAVRDADLALYYRLDNDYQASEAVVLEKDGEMQIRRIVAVEGDVVDVTADGLKINGYFQQETGIYSETLPYIEGISYPLTLGTDEYFVLGDERTGAKDSRIYGAVKKSEIKGSVMTLLRRRGI